MSRGKAKSFPFGSASPVQTACLISFAIREIFNPNPIISTSAFATKSLATSIISCHGYCTRTVVLLQARTALVPSKLKPSGQGEEGEAGATQPHCTP